MGGIGDPDRRQLASTVQLGQHSSVAAIGLDPISSLGRNQRRSHDDAVMPASAQQPMQPIATRASLVTDAQPTTAVAQSLCQLQQDLDAVLDNADLADFAVAPTFCDRNRNRRLVHIQPNVSGSIHQACLPCIRLCARAFGTILDILHVERRAARSPREHRV
jgi:hypothetical protein